MPALTSRMQRVLVELSAYHDPEPSAVLRRVLNAMDGIYGGTMAMVNILQEDRIGFRDAVNVHPCFGDLTTVSLADSY